MPYTVFERARQRLTEHKKSSPNSKNIKRIQVNFSFPYLNLFNIRSEI